MDSEATLKPGDVCFDCLKIGLVKYLRYFKINLNGDTLLKCESNMCMYPYNSEFSSDDEEKEVNKPNTTNDLLPQLNHEWAPRSTTNDSQQIGESITDEDFDLSFLDDLNEDEPKGLGESGITVHINKFADQFYVKDSKNEYSQLPNVTSMQYESVFNSSHNNNNKQKDIKLSDLKYTNLENEILYTTQDTKASCLKNTVGIIKNYKEKVVCLPTSSKIFSDITLKSPTKSNSLDIPKANINKENDDLLKEITKTELETNLPKKSAKSTNQEKEVTKKEEKEAKKVAKKLPKRTKKSKKKNKKLVDNTKEEETPPNNDIDYSLDQISELLLSVKK